MSELMWYREGMSSRPPSSDGTAEGQDHEPKKRGAPTRRLPTPRISFPRQLDLLRAYAAASDGGTKPVDNKDVAQFVGMSKDTVSLANPFFADAGFLTRVEGGYLPAPAVLNFARVHQWDAEKAGAELGPLMRRTWFAEALLPRLAFNAMAERDAIIELAKEAGANKSYEPQIATLLDYLATAGLVMRENGMLTRSRSISRQEPEASPPDAEPASASVIAAEPQGGQLPLLIQGLLEQLPSGGEWTREAADKWLELARLTFDLVYKIPPAKKEGRSD
jgi:hypothetical protein